MKATARWLAPVAVACATLLVAADLQAKPGQRGSGSGARGGHAHGGARHDGHRNWSGNRGHWRGNRGYWSGHGHWGSSWGLYFGLPLLAGAAWGWPYYYYDYGYPGETVIYREVEREPMPYPEGTLQPMPSDEVAPGPGAPTRGPLYMNYCESARAYFPKVTSCPEGWRLTAPAS